MSQREGRIQSAERAVPTFSIRTRLRTFFQPDSGGLQAQSRKEGRNGCQAAAGSPESGAVQETSERARQRLSSRAIRQVFRVHSNSTSQNLASAFRGFAGR